MIEDIRLNPLVIHPHDRIGKEIELHRKPRFGGLQLPHHQRHILVHRHLVPKVADQIGPENPEVGLMQAVDTPFPGADAVRGVVLLDTAFGLIDVVADQVDRTVVVQHLGVQKRTLVMSIATERITRRPPESCMACQLVNESVVSR